MRLFGFLQASEIFSSFVFLFPFVSFDFLFLCLFFSFCLVFVLRIEGPSEGAGKEEGSRASSLYLP